MALGMTYDQYWYGDPLMVRAYYKADRIRQKRMNDEAWLYGAYVLRALEATVGNMFRKSGSPPITYPKEPIWEDEWEEKQRRDKQREEKEALRAEAYMMNMVLAGKSWGKPK